LRLIVSTYFVGACTGSSDGFLGVDAVAELLAPH
jgi:hypothetical protein